MYCIGNGITNYLSYSCAQASVHGLSKRQRSRLLAHDLKLRRLAEEERRREEEERLREREMQAVPTLEDMENMQYLRTQ